MTVRRTSIRAACLVFSVTAVAAGRASAQSQLEPPPPVPQSRPQTQVYTPTYRPSYGTPSQPVLPQNSPNAQWPQQQSPTLAPSFAQRQQQPPPNPMNGPTPTGAATPAGSRNGL